MNEKQTQKPFKQRPWIGVDLDGTLAHYDGWKGPDNIGEPIKPMADRVKSWLDAGVRVKIFTERVSPEAYLSHDQTLEATLKPIQQWCLTNLGFILEITHEKDMRMIQIWDDRAISVELNTGRITSETTINRIPGHYKNE